jgi:hypothetical protein
MDNFYPPPQFVSHCPQQNITPSFTYMDGDGAIAGANMICLQPYFSSAVTTLAARTTLDDLRFILDSGCHGGSLLTTVGAELLLNDARPTATTVVSATTSEQAHLVGTLIWKI